MEFFTEKRSHFGPRVYPMGSIVISLVHSVSRGRLPSPFKIWIAPQFLPLTHPLGLRKLIPPFSRLSLFWSQLIVKFDLPLYYDVKSPNNISYLSRVIYDSKVALNKVKYSKNLISGVTFVPISFSKFFLCCYFEFNLCLTQKNLIPPPQKKKEVPPLPLKILL